MPLYNGKLKEPKYGLICVHIHCPKCINILNKHICLPHELKIGDNWTCVHCKVKLIIESIIHDEIQFKMEDIS